MGISAYDSIGFNNLNLPTLQELMMAPQYLTEKHEKMEEEIGIMRSEGEVIANLRESSQEVENRYQSYQAKLNAIAEDLSSKGITKPKLRSQIGAAKAEFVKSVLPVLEADKALKADISAITQSNLQGQNLIYDESKLNIDTYLGNNGASIVNQSVSGTLLKASFGEKMKALIEEQDLLQAEKYKELLPYQWMFLTKKGLTTSQVNKITGQNFDDAEISQFSEYIQRSLESTLEEQNVYAKFGDNQDLVNRSIEAALSGAYLGVGSTGPQIVGDNFGMQVALNKLRGSSGGSDPKEDTEGRISSIIHKGAYTKSLNKVTKALTELNTLSEDPKDVYSFSEVESFRKLGIPTQEKNADGIFERLPDHIIQAHGENLVNTAQFNFPTYPLDLKNTTDKEFAKMLSSALLAEGSKEASKIEGKIIAKGSDNTISGLVGTISVNPILGSAQMTIRKKRNKTETIDIPVHLLDDILKEDISLAKMITGSTLTSLTPQYTSTNVSAFTPSDYTKSPISGDEFIQLLFHASRGIQEGYFLEGSSTWDAYNKRISEAYSVSEAHGKYEEKLILKETYELANKEVLRLLLSNFEKFSVNLPNMRDNIKLITQSVF